MMKTVKEKRYSCRKHRVRGSRYPCSQCEAIQRTLREVGTAGSDVADIRRLLVQRGHVTPRRRAGVLAAALALERSLIVPSR